MMHDASFGFPHPLHALVLVVRRLLDAVGMVLEGGVAAGVVLLLLGQTTDETNRADATNIIRVFAKNLSN